MLLRKSALKMLSAEVAYLIGLCNVNTHGKNLSGSDQH
jgi:hypothetical protein